GICLAGGKVDLTNEKDKTSYSIGYQVGDDFKRQGIEIRQEMLLQGFKDAHGNQEPALSEEGMRQALIELQKRVTAAQDQKNKEEAAKNLKEGQDFLIKNSQLPKVKTLPSGLQYKVLQQGSGASPNPEDQVTVHYRGTLINGKEFDSSYRRNQPVAFQVNQVIKGWQEALTMMKEGAKWQLFIPPRLAYGEGGAGSRIGPNSTLIFELELLSIQTGEMKSTGK
ncbi:MAG TPA: FKBP-type peptidyl-prolyl cis-trans isomerase, partial [Geopsychrobacteraceae bacterium]|nr:FKBP-type peptidyl-prolyl cis-trans isomerase [Geopsychrobacteraceae bacterium]